MNEASLEWEGVVSTGILNPEAERRRTELADAARAYRWPAVLAMVRSSRNLANAVRLGGPARFAPLHQAAHGGAPLSVVRELVALGAWRTLRTAAGDRPVDLACARGHHHLIAVLEPVLKRAVAADVLAALQAHLHQVILGRARPLVEDNALLLPDLAPLLEFDPVSCWFPVPGMYGGFSYRLASDGADPLLVVESWSRVVGGSGQRHEITAAGAKLVDEGFV